MSQIIINKMVQDGEEGFEVRVDMHQQDVFLATKALVIMLARSSGQEPREVLTDLVLHQMAEEGQVISPRTKELFEKLGIEVNQ